MKRFLSLTLALSVLLTGGTMTVVAEGDAVPVAVDEAVYAQLLENKWSCDDDRDGVITEAELAAATSLNVDLTGIEDLSWLSLLPSCRYLSLKNGTITDYSALKDMPALRSLDLDALPIEDISFLKDLDLETCYISNMDSITTAQKLEVMRFSDPEIWAGTSGQIEYRPRGLADFELALADTESAVFVNGEATSPYPDEYIYGRKPGTTAYSVLVDGTVYHTGTVTIRETPGAYDPALHDTLLDRYKVDRSSYYNAHPIYSSGPIALVDGTLYALRGSKVEAVEKEVRDYDYHYTRANTSNYVYADIVLKENGTLYVNGKPFIRSIVTAIQDGYFISEGALFIVTADGEDLTFQEVAEDAQLFVQDCSPFYLTPEGMLKYAVVKSTSDGSIKTSTISTGIGRPLYTCKAGATVYVVDRSHVLYELETSGTFQKTVLAEDAAWVGWSEDHSRIEYEKNDGTLVTVKEFITSGGIADRARIHLGIDAGVFYLPEYQERGIAEDDAVFYYYIDQDGVLSLDFCGDYAGLTHVEAALGESYDDELDHGFVYFLRTDGSIWGYDLDAKQWQEAAAGTEPIPQPGVLWGDVNADHVFDVLDIVLFQKWLHGMPDAVLTDSQAADMNADAQHDILDLAMMKRELIRRTYPLTLTVTTNYGGYGVAGQDLGHGSFDETFDVKEGDVFYENFNGHLQKNDPTMTTETPVLTIDSFSADGVTFTSYRYGEQVTQTAAYGTGLADAVSSTYTIYDGINFDYELTFGLR